MTKSLDFGDEKEPWNQTWPTTEQLKQICKNQNIKLLRIHFSLNLDKSLKSLQFEFTGNLFSEKTGLLGKKTTVTVDQGAMIKWVQVKINSWNHIFGLRFKDSKGKAIVDQEWAEQGKWTEDR